jgi:hypothetical protein
VDSLFDLVVTTYVLNQSKSHWLLSNALHFAIIMCLKFKEEITNPFVLVNLINDDYGIDFELFLFTSNIRKEVCGVFYSFLSFLGNFEERKAHNMLSLMVDPRFKSFRLIYFFVGRKEGVSIVVEYDRRTLYPMLLRCYHHLHPMTKFVGCVDQTCDEDFDLDFFNRLHPQMSHERDLPPRNY